MLERGESHDGALLVGLVGCLCSVLMLASLLSVLHGRMLTRSASLLLLSGRARAARATTAGVIATATTLEQRLLAGVLTFLILLRAGFLASLTLLLLLLLTLLLRLR
jgi:hypothetical protein